VLHTSELRLNENVFDSIYVQHHNYSKSTSLLLAQVTVALGVGRSCFIFVFLLTL